MKTKKHPVKHAAKKTVKKAARSAYACSVCGTVVEADPCGCGCESAAELICCGRPMTKKRAA